MENKKEFVILIVSVVLVVLLVGGIYFAWNKMIFGSLQNVTKNASKAAGVEVNTQDSSSKGQIDSVRDMMGKIQDKRNAEIENELK